MGRNYFYEFNATKSQMKNLFFLFPLVLCFHASLFVTSSAFELEVVFNINGQVPFTYNESTGRGPSRWGQLDPAWRTCSEGKLQSPIDFNDANVTLLVFDGMSDLITNYTATSNATIMSRGRDIAVNWTGNAGKITIEDVDYKLQQIHWHTPSEHTINGARYDLELHIVHANSQGHLAVIGILYQIAQSPDPFLSTMLPFITNVTKQPTNIGIIDPNEINSGHDITTHYMYGGSISVPPCTEGILWTVLKEVRAVSQEQVQALTNAVDNGFQQNARPVQPINGRAVYLHETI